MKELILKKRMLEFAALLYLVVWSISSPLQVALIYRIIALGCAVILAFKNGFEIRGKQFYYLLFIVLVAFTAIIQAWSIGAVMNQISIYMLFLGYLLNCWYEEDWYVFRIIVPITLLLLVYWNFQTTNALADDPNAARTVVRNSDEANTYLEQGVGGYALIYCQVIIVPAIVSWMVNAFKNHKIFFACGVAWAISFYRLLMVSGYTIAIVATIISIICLFLYKKKSVIPVIVVSALIVFLIVYLIGYNEGFRNFLLTTFDGTEIAQKVNDIYLSITTDTTADSIMGRIAAYQASLETIITYPFIGCWFWGGVGGHSAILDAFAKYGILGGAIMASMIYYVPISWKKRLAYDNSKLQRTVNSTIISVTFVAMLDPVPYQFVVMLTVVLPIILSCIKEWSVSGESIVDSKYDTGKPRKLPQHQV